MAVSTFLPVPPWQWAQPERVACMTERELVLWEEANEYASPRAARPCKDCTVAFARAMRREGRCNGMPGSA